MRAKTKHMIASCQKHVTSCQPCLRATEACLPQAAHELDRCQPLRQSSFKVSDQQLGCIDGAIGRQALDDEGVGRRDANDSVGDRCASNEY